MNLPNSPTTDYSYEYTDNDYLQAIRPFWDSIKYDYKPTHYDDYTYTDNDYLSDTQTSLDSLILEFKEPEEPEDEYYDYDDGPYYYEELQKYQENIDRFNHPEKYYDEDYRSLAECEYDFDQQDINRTPEGWFPENWFSET